MTVLRSPPQAIFELSPEWLISSFFPQNRRLRRAETAVWGCEQAPVKLERRPTDRSVGNLGRGISFGFGGAATLWEGAAQRVSIIRDRHRAGADAYSYIYYYARRSRPPCCARRCTHGWLQQAAAAGISIHGTAAWAEPDRRVTGMPELRFSDCFRMRQLLTFRSSQPVPGAMALRGREGLCFQEACHRACASKLGLPSAGRRQPGICSRCV